MESAKHYCSYDGYSLIYDIETHKFDIFYLAKPLVENAYVEGIYRNGVKIRDIKDLQVAEVKRSVGRYEDDAFLAVYYREEGAEDNSLILHMFAGNYNVRIEAETPENNTVKIAGRIVPNADNPEDVFAVCLDRKTDDLRAAFGSAVSTVDHALYNKMKDTAIVVGKSGQTSIHFDRQQGQYTFELTIGGEWKNAIIAMQKNVLAEKYHITFSPINKNSTFSTPPVGWMTWYAVKFDASEDIILKNAKWQAENLKDYGANTIWVDWEWYHPAFNCEGCEEINSLQPNPEKYPHGMKYLADQIKELGMIPSLWIGYTNEPSVNKYIEMYPDIVLAEDLTWCGKYYYDFSNPHYLNEYLPEAVGNVLKWGYEAIKYDTIPISMSRHEKYHMNMYDPSLTTREAYLNMIRKTREILGKDMYMLSCSGSNNASILWASDIFDAARIGEDIFTWEENMNNIARLLTFYPLHNIQLYNDPDNVVLREEFNNYEQAKSRAVFTSLLGLPMTFGDEFSALDEERIELIKKALPILDIHPMDLCVADFDRKDFLINLNIAKEYETYQVSGVFNMREESACRKLNLSADLHLENGTYLAYDFYRDAFLGEINDEIELEFLPYECRVISLRPVSGMPQIISTSRHITQGAAEILDMQYTEDKLHLRTSLVANDKYTVTIYVPEGYRMKEYSGFEGYTVEKNLLRLSILPSKTQEYVFDICFEKEV